MNNKECNTKDPRMFKKIIFLGILIVGSFVLLECIGRIVLTFYPEDYFVVKFPETYRFKSDSVLGWDWRPGYNLAEERFGKITSFNINQQGFKDREFSLTKPENTIRIICVGDSITEGVGVSNTQTYPKVLERMLNSGINVKKFEVMNAGVADYCLAQEYFLIKSKLLKFHPDVVIIGYYLNDGRLFARPKDFYGGSILKYLLEKSAFVKWLNLYITKVAVKVQFKHWEKGRERWVEVYKSDKWITDPAALANLIASANHDWGSAWTEYGKVNTEKYLAEINNLSKRYNFKLIVLCFPIDVQLEAQNPGKIDLFYPQQFLKGLCKKNDIYFLDISSSLKKHKKDEKILYDHCHYTERGMEIIAADIKEFLLLNNILKY